MYIWSTRKQSQHWLQNELADKANVIHRGFELTQKLVDIWTDVGHSEGETLVGQFGRVYAITLAKANHLLLGSYSLMLDGLGQEAGALLRPLLETYELLVYFCLDPTRVEEVINDTLPEAGKIAKSISGQFQNLRAYLNQNASHFGYQPDSVRHLLDFGQTISIKAIPTQGIHVLRTNLTVVNAFQVFVLMEAVNGLFALGFDANELADEVEMLRTQSVSAFLSPKTN